VALFPPNPSVFLRMWRISIEVGQGDDGGEWKGRVSGDRRSQNHLVLKRGDAECGLDGAGCTERMAVNRFRGAHPGRVVGKESMDGLSFCRIIGRRPGSVSVNPRDVGRRKAGGRDRLFSSLPDTLAPADGAPSCGRHPSQIRDLTEMRGRRRILLETKKRSPFGEVDPLAVQVERSRGTC